MAPAKSRPKKIVIDESILMSVEQHSYSNLEAEVGGMFFGKVEDGKTKISGSIPALKAEAQQIRLTFTQEVWEEILREGNKLFPGEQIVGWYHTHPSFGLFLSEYDQFIQRNFFGNPGQVAMVIDPIAGTMGWFELRKNGQIPLLSEEPTKTGPKSPTPPPVSAKSRNARGFGVIAITAVLTAAITYGVSLGFAPPDQRAQVLYLQNQFFQLQQVLQGQLQLSYMTRDGDTLESLTNTFFGDKAATSNLTDYNSSVDFKNLKPGTMLNVVGPVGMGLNLNPLEPKTDPTSVPEQTPAASAEPTKTATPKAIPVPTSTPGVITPVK